MRAFTKKESEIKIINEEKSMTGGMNIVNVKGLRNEPGDLNVQGVTWVNELGIYGNFGNDADENGIADGWQSYTRAGGSLSAYSVSGGVQHFTPATKYGGIGIVNRFDDFDAGDVLYARAMVLSDNNAVQLYFRRNGTDAAQSGSEYLGTATDYKLLETKITTTENTTDVEIFTRTETGDLSEIHQKKTSVYNLTRMGQLPYALRNYFGKTYWEDLTYSELNEAIPYYVNAVETVGYSFDDGEITPYIVNRGKNLIDLNETLERRNYGYTEFWLENDYLYVETTHIGNRGVEWYIPCKKNTTYTLSGYCERIYGDSQYYFITGMSSLGNCIGEFSQTIDSGENNELNLEIYQKSQMGKFRIKNLQLEEGSSQTDYEKAKQSKVQLPEMNGINGVYDSLSDKRTNRETVSMTSGSGTVSDSGTGNCVLIDSSGGVTWGTISGTTVTASGAEGAYTAIYKLSTPVAQDPLPTKIPIYTGDNNIICEGAAISITHTKETTTNEILAFAEGIRITDSKSFYEYQPVNATGKRRLENLRDYKISIDDIYLDDGWDERFESGKTFTLEITDDNDDETNVITTKYHGCVITSVARSEDQYIKRGVEITAESKEVIT